MNCEMNNSEDQVLLEEKTEVGVLLAELGVEDIKGTVLGRVVAETFFEAGAERVQKIFQAVQLRLNGIRLLGRMGEPWLAGRSDLMTGALSLIVAFSRASAVDK